MSELRTNPLHSPSQGSPSQGAATNIDPNHLDARLDQAVAESFPASDPPAVSVGDDPPVKPWPAGQELPGQQAKACPTPARKSHMRKLIPAAAVALIGVGVGIARLVKRRRH